jgi:hypothetical protein
MIKPFGFAAMSIVAGVLAAIVSVESTVAQNLRTNNSAGTQQIRMQEISMPRNGAASVASPNQSGRPVVDINKGIKLQNDNRTIDQLKGDAKNRYDKAMSGANTEMITGRASTLPSTIDSRSNTQSLRNSDVATNRRQSQNAGNGVTGGQQLTVNSGNNTQRFSDVDVPNSTRKRATLDRIKKIEGQIYGIKPCPLC